MQSSFSFDRPPCSLCLNDSEPDTCLPLVHHHVPILSCRMRVYPSMDFLGQLRVPVEYSDSHCRRFPQMHHSIYMDFWLAGKYLLVNSVWAAFRNIYSQFRLRRSFCRHSSTGPLRFFCFEQKPSTCVTKENHFVWRRHLSTSKRRTLSHSKRRKLHYGAIIVVPWVPSQARAINYV